jgi:hypothetical protein
MAQNTSFKDLIHPSYSVADVDSPQQVPPLLPRMSTNLTTEHAELGNADDTTIDPSVSKFLHTFLPSQIPIVSGKGTSPPVKSEREWTGIMGFSEDGQPFVGNDVEEPRRWVIGGFHGHGMVRIYLCAKALVEALLAVDEGREVEWPEWMPCGYINRPDRIPVGEVEEYMTLTKDIPNS